MEARDWIDIKTEADVNRLMECVGQFHDWYVSGYAYDALGGCDDDDLNLCRLKEGLDALTITFRWDCTRHGKWPEVQLKLGDVRAFDISLIWLQEGCPLSEAWLEETEHGWVLIDDRPLAPKERENPKSVKSNLFALSGNVQWRPLAVVDPDNPEWWA